MLKEGHPCLARVPGDLRAGGFWESHFSRITVGAPAKIDPCRARVKGPDLIFWKNVEMPKKDRKFVSFFFRKCPKSVSLDSGHLD